MSVGDFNDSTDDRIIIGSSTGAGMDAGLGLALEIPEVATAIKL